MMWECVCCREGIEKNINVTLILHKYSYPIISVIKNNNNKFTQHELDTETSFRLENTNV